MRARPAVLITGAAGYLGRITVAALAARREAFASLTALDVQPPPAPTPGVEHRVMDVCDPALGALVRERRIDTVVHLASIVRPPPGAPPDLAFRVDVEGTRNVLEACAAGGVGHLVVTSSGAAYGYHPDNRRGLEEDDPLRGHPRFAYAKHKRLVEELLAAWRERAPEPAQLVLRPGTILGETTASPITDLFEKPVMLGVAGHEAPFVFVWDEDVAEAIVTGVLERRTGVFNLAGDGTMSPREIARALGKPYLPVPAPVLRGTLAVLSRLGVTQYGPEQVDFLRYRPVLSNRRFKAAFAPLPRRTSREAFALWAEAREGRRRG